MRSWYVRWFERSLEAYVRGRVSGREAISLNNILGRARRVLREGYLSKEDLLAVIDSMAKNPASLPEIPRDVKEKALEEFREAIVGSL